MASAHSHWTGHTHQHTHCTQCLQQLLYAACGLLCLQSKPIYKLFSLFSCVCSTSLLLSVFSEVWREKKDKIQTIKHALLPVKPTSWVDAGTQNTFSKAHTLGYWSSSPLFTRQCGVYVDPQMISGSRLPESFSRPPKVMIDDKLLWERKPRLPVACRVTQTKPPLAGLLASLTWREVEMCLCVYAVWVGGIKASRELFST